MSAQLEILDDGPSPQFTAADAAEMQRHEAVIKEGLEVFVAVGQALGAILSKRYYLMTHLSFEAYCREKWSLSKAEAYKAIGDADVMEDLSPIGDIIPMPENRAQLRALATLKEPEERREVWADAVEQRGDGHPATAREVSEAIARRNGHGVPTIEEDEPETPLPLSGGENFYVSPMKPKLAPGKAGTVEAPADEPPPEKAKPPGDEWYTLAKHVASAKKVMGRIELDPASCEMADEVVGAVRYFTKERNGLLEPWESDAFFMNCPYSETKTWIEKFVSEVRSGNLSKHSIVLVNAKTETEWFQWLWDLGAVVCFVSGRISFTPGDRASSQTGWSGSAFVYVGPNPEAFAREYIQYGPIVRPWDSWDATNDSALSA